eukprot:Gb_25290 [translate_table: standard]
MIVGCKTVKDSCQATVAGHKPERTDPKWIVTVISHECGIIFDRVNFKSVAVVLTPNPIPTAKLGSHAWFGNPPGRDNQLRKAQESKTYSAKLSEHKKKEKEAVKQGKRPFYLKKSELWKQELLEKYESLKANGKLEAFLAKRRRKNAAKDHRYVPYRRPANVA